MLLHCHYAALVLSLPYAHSSRMSLSCYGIVTKPFSALHSGSPAVVSQPTFAGLALHTWHDSQTLRFLLPETLELHIHTSAYYVSPPEIPPLLPVIHLNLCSSDCTFL